VNKLSPIAITSVLAHGGHQAANAPEGSAASAKALGEIACLAFLESRASTALITTTIVIAAIGMALPFTSLGGFLGFVPLPPAYWLALNLILMSYVVLTHFVKTWFIRRFGLS
jgi:hypothetical protein